MSATKETANEEGAPRDGPVSDRASTYNEATDLVTTHVSSSNRSYTSYKVFFHIPPYSQSCPARCEVVVYVGGVQAHRSLLFATKETSETRRASVPPAAPVRSCSSSTPHRGTEEHTGRAHRRTHRRSHRTGPRRRVVLRELQREQSGPGPGAGSFRHPENPILPALGP